MPIKRRVLLMLVLSLFLLVRVQKTLDPDCIKWVGPMRMGFCCCMITTQRL